MTQTKCGLHPICFNSKKNIKRQQALKVKSDVITGSFELELEKTDGLKAGDWIELSMRNNDPIRVAKELYPYQANPKWKDIVENGVVVRVYHKLKSVGKNKIILADPTMYPVYANEGWEIRKWQPAEYCGVENLHFKGNFREKFVHHRSAIDDGGWSILQINGQVNSWLRDCVFEDVSNAARIQ